MSDDNPKFTVAPQSTAQPMDQISDQMPESCTDQPPTDQPLSQPSQMPTPALESASLLESLRSPFEQLAAEQRAQVAALEQQKQELLGAIAILERKKERLEQEMRTTYAGQSQEVAVRLQGFRDYLVGSLQELVACVEKLDLVPPPAPIAPEPPGPVFIPEPDVPNLAEQGFGDLRQRIEQLLERYRTLPDYYGPPWKLRRTFELSHSERVANWFFNQAGRGAMRTMGTRLQNILVASAAISILRTLYGEKVRVLVLATAPERLGEWRRGFQDCLGLTRDHFGPEKGVVLYEDPEPLVLKGDRLTKEGQMPLVILDEAEEAISVDLLRFPLLIAYGRDPERTKPSYPSPLRERETRDSREEYSERDRDRGRDRDRVWDW
ncbi:MAG: DUF3086 domain-containing protein [Oscillatoriales cyanobacterium SM2_2_1]|nr:DUF3086 domain-containing protein [Oscillatoriales cyanobacterium SM2_2_1]